MKADSTHVNTEGADLLRGVAILMVVVYHCVGPIYGFHLPWDGWVRDFSAGDTPILLHFLSLGWAGVALFFVISGFCIHYSYLRTANLKPRSFFWRRFWRIYPAYIVALIAFSVAFRLNVLSRGGAGQFLSHLLFFHNCSERWFFGINASFWSIAVEIQLYLLFPVLLFIRSRLGIAWTVATLFAVGCAWRAVTIILWGFPDHLINAAWSSPLMTWFDWSIGALIAERFRAGHRVFPRPLVWLALLLPLFGLSTLYKPLTPFCFSLAATISAIALEMTLHVQWRDVAWVRPLAFIGIISYSLYLWHQPLLIPLDQQLAPIFGSPTVAWISVIALLIASSWLSFRLLELPGISLGQWIWNRSGVGAQSPSKFSNKSDLTAKEPHEVDAPKRPLGLAEATSD
jgi:peptidoglycan/LPS O-acetylase OafA/YrhL